VTVNPSRSPSRPGLPVGSVRQRQARLPEPLLGLHRRLLSGFLLHGGPPQPRVVATMAAELGLDLDQALQALAAADLVHVDPASGQISVAYPFSGRPSPHQVWLDGGIQVQAMCALDALGIPQMTGRDAPISSTDPTSGQPITVEVDDQGCRWQPTTTVVLAGTTTISDACAFVSDCCCPYINFHASPRDADSYRRAHPSMTAELLDQAEAVEAAGRSFGGLLHPDSERRGDRHGHG
jgi:alkylmercury lyase